MNVYSYEFEGHWDEAFVIVSAKSTKTAEKVAKEWGYKQTYDRKAFDIVNSKKLENIKYEGNKPTVIVGHYWVM